nr:DUF4917 family protein [uncultured Pseudomonas sp.]
MPYQIYDWLDIAEHCSDNLLLGNGASIAINNSFNYRSLKEKAEEKGLFTPAGQKLFDDFETVDFELILRLVWQAYRVNTTLEINDTKTENTYKEVRTALIETVREIHPPHASVAKHFRAISGFSKNFSNIYSLNYDLILYWATLWSNDSCDWHEFKDCFNGDLIFRDDWRTLRRPYRGTHVTLVFYPHGNLYLSRNITEFEKKIRARGDVLLDRILADWRSEMVVPLFVSEGTQEQKVNSIMGSRYLSTVYRESIKEAQNSLTVYGWGFGEQDKHILRAFKSSQIKHIAVSVSNRPADQIYCARVHAMISEVFGREFPVIFFDRASLGAWNNTLQSRQ